MKNAIVTVHTLSSHNCFSLLQKSTCKSVPRVTHGANVGDARAVVDLHKTHNNNSITTKAAAQVEGKQ
jgi:hypothetical protein